ncbi:MAG: ERCC4 domain-containing protein [Propioniciclava sp.]
MELLIARNPEDSSLPYLVLIPLDGGIVLRVKDTWPRTAKIYCHRHGLPWPDEPEIVERIPLRSYPTGCGDQHRADRSRESRSQFVITRARGREMIFWQNARTAKAARPQVRLPTARASGLDDLEIVVDTREKYAWTFTDQQVSTRREALRVGDYAVLADGQPLAVVERKSLPDLTGALTGGRLIYRLEELAEVPRAVVVVEDRYSAIFKLTHVRPVWSPRRWPSARSGCPRCRSSSPKPGSWPRNGRSAFSGRPCGSIATRQPLGGAEPAPEQATLARGCDGTVTPWRSGRRRCPRRCVASRSSPSSNGRVLPGSPS